MATCAEAEMEGIIEITWNETERQGHIDVVPGSSFADEQSGREFVHETKSPGGRCQRVKCLLNVVGNEVLLDYGHFREFNGRCAQMPGQTIIVFADPTRTSVREIYWCPQGSPRKLANATISQVQDVVRLDLVSSIVELQQAISLFNQDAASDQRLTQELLRQTTYWVYSLATAQFGPSKFVGFRNMTLEHYRRARNGHRIGDRFDGHVTRRCIEHVLGHKYSPDEGLGDRLESWAIDITGDAGVLTGVDRSKWRFVVFSKFDAG